MLFPRLGWKSKTAASCHETHTGGGGVTELCGDKLNDDILGEAARRRGGEASHSSQEASGPT